MLHNLPPFSFFHHISFFPFPMSSQSLMMKEIKETSFLMNTWSMEMTSSWRSVLGKTFRCPASIYT